MLFLIFRIYLKINDTKPKIVELGMENTRRGER
jgi:hypothetical protein